MEKQEFEELKKEFKGYRQRELSTRIGYLIGIVDCRENLTRLEILKLMHILFY